MAKLALFQKVAENAALVLNDPWLDETAADALYLRLDCANDPLQGALTLFDNGINANIDTGNYAMRFQSNRQNTGNAIQFNTGFAHTGANDTFRISSVGTKLFGLNTEGAEFTVPLLIADDAQGLYSGAYSVQMESGVADGASAVGFSFKTTNNLSNSAAKLISIANNGIESFIVEPNVAGISTFFNTTARLTIVPNSASFQDVEFSGADVNGGYYFSVGANAVGLFPSFGLLTGSANVAGIATTNGLAGIVTARVNLDGSTLSLYPQGNLGLGDSVGNSITRKWTHLNLRDAGPARFGNNLDATIQWDGTDLLVNPDAQAAGGRLRVDSASSWAAQGAVTAPTAFNFLPTGFTGTTRKWLILKDNAGAVYCVQAWSQA